LEWVYGFDCSGCNCEDGFESFFEDEDEDDGSCNTNSQCEIDGECYSMGIEYTSGQWLDCSCNMIVNDFDCTADNGVDSEYATNNCWDWLGDDYCDDGEVIDFNCSPFGFDNGDCEEDDRNLGDKTKSMSSKPRKRKRTFVDIPEPTDNSIPNWSNYGVPSEYHGEADNLLSYSRGNTYNDIRWELPKSCSGCGGGVGSNGCAGFCFDYNRKKQVLTISWTF